MPGSTPATYRQSHEGFAVFGAETGELSSVATSLGAAPTMALAGKCDLPEIDDVRNPAVDHAVGSYQGVDIIKGGREPMARLNMRIGEKTLLQNGLRTSGLGGVIGLPIFSFAGGAISNYESSHAFNFILRYALINSVSMQIQEKQPITASVEMWGHAIQTGGSARSVTQSSLEVLAKTLTWRNFYFLINGVSYRDVIASVSLNWSNGLARIGERNDEGDNNDMSGISYSIMPGLETVNVSYQMHDKLPDSLIRATQNSTNWGAVVIKGDDSAAGGSNVVTLTISNNMFARQGMQGIQPGQPMRFNTNTTSRVLSLT